MADQVVVPSTAAYNFLRTLGHTTDHITLTPSTVDNDWWKKSPPRLDRAAVRRSWGLICRGYGRPLLRQTSTLETLPSICSEHSDWPRFLIQFLVFAGEGPQRSELETEAIP